MKKRAITERLKNTCLEQPRISKEGGLRKRHELGVERAHHRQMHIYFQHVWQKRPMDHGANAVPKSVFHVFYRSASRTVCRVFYTEKKYLLLC